MPGQHLDQHDAGRPDVGFAIERAAERLLRGHVGDGAGESVGLAGGLLADVGEAEVDDLDGRRRGCEGGRRRLLGGRRITGDRRQRLLGEHDVRWLDIAMLDAPGVGIFEAAQDLNRDVGGLGGRKHAGADSLGQRFALIERHGDEAAVVGGVFDAVDDADIRVVEGGGGPRLAQEALFVAFAGVEVGGQELERDGSLQFDIEGAIDHTHATGPGGAENPVVGGYEFPYRGRALCIGHPSVTDLS